MCCLYIQAEMEMLEFTVVKRMINTLFVVLEICCNSFIYYFS